MTPAALELAFRRCLARVSLQKKGYTLRTAAPHLGVHFGHLHQVLQGKRDSRSLLLAVEALPPHPSKTTHVISLH